MYNNSFFRSMTQNVKKARASKGKSYNFVTINSAFDDKNVILANKMQGNIKGSRSND